MNLGFLLCSAHEKALSKWDVVYEIVAVISNAAVILIDYPPILLHALVILKSSSKDEFIVQAFCNYLGFGVFHFDCEQVSTEHFL